DINDDDDDDNFQDLFDDDTSDKEEENEQDYMPISINIDEIKNNLHNAINHYWPNLISPSSLLPSLLDPRTEVKSTPAKKKLKVVFFLVLKTYTSYS
ncbi:4686_t:CDS:2, partial [Racocetra persica]